MRRNEEDFGECELELVHVSRRLHEAKAVEALLGEAGIEYLVEPRTYRGTILLVVPVERVGAFFYVRPEDAAASRGVLTAAGRSVVAAEQG